MMMLTSHRRLLAPLLSATLLSATLAGPITPGIAKAQVATFDAANYAQNLLTAAHTLQQINNQITMLQHQTQSLTNQTKNLTALPTSNLAQLQQNITKTQQLLAQAQKIAYDVNQINQAFGSTYGSVPISASQQSQVTSAQSRWQITVAGLQDAMRTQATVIGNVGSNQTQMTALVSTSQSATGALAATQAGNQMLALQAQQLSDLTALIAANGRAQALKDAEAATAADQGRQQRTQFLTSTPYQPGNAQMFNGN